MGNSNFLYKGSVQESSPEQDPTPYMSVFLRVLVVIFLGLGGNFALGSRRFGLKDDDYYEEFYLRKIPKLRVSPAKVKEFFANHLSWFPVDDLQGRNGREEAMRFPRTASPTPGKNHGGLVDSVKNMTVDLIKGNMTALKNESAKVGNYMEKFHLKGKIKNMTHPFRPRGNPHHTTMLKYMTTTTTARPCTEQYIPRHTTKFTCRTFGPTVRINPKKRLHPRKIRVYIDVGKGRKVERHAKPSLNGTEPTNSTHTLENAEEMATDLAGRVTNLWKCVVGSRRNPQIKDIKYYLYTRRNIIEPEVLRVNYDLIKNKSSEADKSTVECAEVKPADIDDFQRISDENREIIKSNFLSLRAPTKILIHGYTGSYKDTRMAKIKDAYLSTGRYNVIQVDWEVLAAPPCYIRVTHHSRFVGEIVARFIDGLYLIGLNMSLVHLVGFSLGAQVAGLAGNMVTLSKICRITDSSGHLDKYDADFVDVIHTCGGILAMLDPVGHVDFYPNGGSRQPGCEFSNLKCSHSRAPQYFAESVTSKKKFVAQLCSSWDDYTSGGCNSTATAFMGEPCSIKSEHDLDGRREELLRSLSKSLADEKPKLNISSRGPFTNTDLNSDILPVNSSELSDKNDIPTCTPKVSVSSEGEASSDTTESGKGNENIGIVKSILGPSFEDAVLRTLEFGKSLIQKGEHSPGKLKGLRREKKREGKEKRKPKCLGKGSGEGDKLDKRSHRKETKEHRAARRRMAFAAMNEKEMMQDRKGSDSPLTRPLNLAKIRSLDSELKQVAQTPEKIKRQLEALIQINKDEPPECISTWGYLYPKEYRPLKTHLEYTVMPSTVRQTFGSISKEEGCSGGSKCTASGTCCEGSKSIKTVGGGESTSSRVKTNSVDERSSTRRAPNAVRQAPEYLSNALGPTLDVSIMDNLKLMRNLFKCEKSEPDERGEPQPGSTVDVQDSEYTHGQDERENMQRMEDLQRKVDELLEKQMRLEREIEAEELEREAKRKAFEEEEKKMETMKASLLQLAEEERVRESHKRQSILECRDYEQKFEALKSRIKTEENRLNSLKERGDSCEMEINEAKRKKENLKRNKSLLDAWDVIASKACHTRLPSFSRIQGLERKNLKPSRDNQHCCFPQQSDDDGDKEDQIDLKGVMSSRSKSLDPKTLRYCRAENEIPYPLQRDVICGMHRLVKTCLCNEPLTKDNTSWSSDDELRRSSRRGTPLQRSKSETGRKEQSAKLCKVLWAVTRINVFQDNSRTYEVMDATTVPPKYPPVKTEGVFVVKNPKKCCPEPNKRFS